MRTIANNFFFAAFFFALGSLPGSASADAVSLDYMAMRCEEGEAEVECYYRYDRPGGNVIEDGCEIYENDPDYSFLASAGGTMGGSSKYCLKAGADIVDQPEQEIDEEQPVQIGEEAVKDDVPGEEQVLEQQRIQAAQAAAREESKLLGAVGTCAVMLALLAFYALGVLKNKKRSDRGEEKESDPLSTDKHDKI